METPDFVRRDRRAGGPAEVRLGVRTGDVEVGGATLKPAYETDEPDGEDCGVVTAAYAELRIAIPDLASLH